MGVIAKDFNDYLWLLSQNHGPYFKTWIEDMIR